MMEKWKSESRLLLLAGVVLCTFLVTPSCKDNAIVEKAGYISGIVTDSLTGLPVDSARMEWGDTVDGIPVLTDINGTYLLQIPVPQPRVFARKEGYRTKWVDTSVVGTHTEGVDFQLTPN